MNSFALILNSLVTTTNWSSVYITGAIATIHLSISHCPLQAPKTSGAVICPWLAVGTPNFSSCGPWCQTWRTDPGQARAHHLIKPTEPHHLQKATSEPPKAQKAKEVAAKMDRITRWTVSEIHIVIFPHMLACFHKYPFLLFQGNQKKFAQCCICTTVDGLWFKNKFSHRNTILHPPPTPITKVWHL